MQGLILAGGKGLRMLPLTEKIPKPMIEINHKPLLQYQIELFRKYNIKNIVLCLHYMPEKIINYFGNGERFGVNLQYSIEKESLGTAGAIKNAENLINDDFLVMYGDNLTDLNLESFIRYHNEKRGFGTIALHERNNNSKGSSIVNFDKNNRITNFIEKPKKGNSKFANAGIYALNRDVLRYIPLFKFDFGFDVFPLLLDSQEQLYGYPIKENFMEVGNLDKLDIAIKRQGGKKWKFL